MATEPNRTEPNRTEPNRTEPNRTEPNRTEPNRTEIIHDLENNFKQNNILKLKQLFPEVFCEDQIDFEKLKLVLGAENLAGAGERYQLDWAGKTAAYLNLQSPTSRTLVPCKEESADFDGTQNVFIEAENLEALKILQKSYAGSVKMIYIDPPYNTGSDSFIYPDKFSESREEYARRVGDTDDAGYLKRDGVFQGAWRKNGKDSGHYHSNWLSMMLPRLHLAKTLLREDGVIFISIDDNEQAQLKLLCDEVFGAENFLANLIWQKKYAATNDAKGFSTLHDYIIVYQKGSEFERNLLPRTEAQNKPYKNDDGDGKGLWRSDNLLVKSFSASAVYPIRNPNTGEEFFPPQGSSWRASQSTMEIWLKENRIFFGKDGLGAPQLKRYLNEVQQGRVPTTWWNFEEVGHNDGANKELQSLFNSKAPFDTPKPTTLLLQMLKIGSNPNDLILDFFSGSGTTAHAVMQLNAEDGGSRRFICVQLPEETDEKSEARKAGFNTIAEIAKERIRRAGRQISDGLQDGSETDTGFKVFKLAESGFKQWRQPEQADTEALQRELSLNIDSVLSETSSENLLYELMLRMGLKLTCKVSFSDDVYFVEDEDTGGLYAFLLERVDQGLIDAVLEKHPVKVVVLDRLFNDDALKSNTVLQMKDAGVMFECV
ncbi:DNA (cytosine-5-)-methyltransferase [Neisseria mucosa ATCC 25996]|uniref:site-specific DNA-methyltransferase (adenine-specific) n=1 Tax=Neisseria mucosa (strain ATCC 25996 / DSM 4631 / NCTC 10774 / M26) TaxID=546266 RepID=D2ZYD5_NEIM2|nr:site-specific DNA-methyltransferase [Neisseria mucosa]EFC87907.1 DNA (cytosine-5-)-methyltransferase [Neisseria mucosa ATCC 25996]